MQSNDIIWNNQNISSVHDYVCDCIENVLYLLGVVKCIYKDIDVILDTWVITYDTLQSIVFYF